MNVNHNLKITNNEVILSELVDYIAGEDVSTIFTLLRATGICGFYQVSNPEKLTVYLSEMNHNLENKISEQLKSLGWQWYASGTCLVEDLLPMVYGKRELCFERV